MDFLEEIHRRLAEISIGGSVLRNQGATGMVATARNFLKKIDLQGFKKSLADQQKFNQFLDDHTAELVKAFKLLAGFNLNGGEGFGAARKSLNLFFREVVYNKFLAEHLDLSTDLEEFNRAIQFLEIPLDADAAAGIIKYCKDHKIEVEGLPDQWTRIINLKPETSSIFQKAAWEIAIKEKTARVHLDLIFWRNRVGTKS